MSHVVEKGSALWIAGLSGLVRLSDSGLHVKLCAPLEVTPKVPQDTVLRMMPEGLGRSTRSLLSSVPSMRAPLSISIVWYLMLPVTVAPARITKCLTAAINCPALPARSMF